MIFSKLSMINLATMNATATVSDIKEQSLRDLPHDDDYARLLDHWKVPFLRVAYYLQVGEIKGTQGWLLHISVVRSQIPSLLEAVLPALLRSRVPFKIPADKETARALLDGELGNHIAGKVITLYPCNTELAVALAKDLIPLTQSFEGPGILTDFHLGGCVYTRYGAFNPVVRPGEGGKEVRYIYDIHGEFVQDDYRIPFRFPEGKCWPFAEILPYQVHAPRKTLHGVYKIIATLKRDIKGNVYQALRVGRWFSVTWCVIKEAKRAMWSDDLGRDMTSRLQWQYDLHRRLEGQVPLPKVYDYFRENGDAYLAMEYISGPSLFDKVGSLYKNAAAWAYQRLHIQRRVLDYLIQVLEIVQQFHKRGYVHRDITPANFIVDKHDRIWPIDLELAYSIVNQSPFPPFEIGTHGFMSPQQTARLCPTVEGDIYALGATMASLFTGFSPLSLDVTKANNRLNCLQFFIGDEKITTLVSSSLSENPDLRPSLQQLLAAILDYRQRIGDARSPQYPSLDRNLVRETAQSAILGLCADPTVISGDLWYTRARSFDPTQGGQQYEYEKNPGLADGVAGVLYLIAKANAHNLDVKPCMKMYNAGWKYIFDYMAKNPQAPLPSGLYGGTAGLALALQSGLASGLVEDTDTNRNHISSWLSPAASRPDLAMGSAGYGVALFACRDFLPESMFKAQMRETVRLLLDARQKNGSWVLASLDNRRWAPSLHFASGNTGIIWFLLEYARIFADASVERIALDCLKLLCRQIQRLLKGIHKDGCRKLFSLTSPIGDGFNGLILALLKAYESTHDHQYLELANPLLRAHPISVIHDNLSQEFGLSGLGEMYLEAFRVAKNEEWKQRADWIAITLFNLAHQSHPGIQYWLSNNQLRPTAYFLTGNSGIAHFLLRSAFPDTIGCPIIS